MVDSFVEKIRNESPTLKHLVYLNHASTCPLHGRTAQALTNYIGFWADYDFEIARNGTEKSRDYFAQIINASKEEVTFTPDVTHGSKLAVNLMDFKKGDNIVCYWNDYPGQVYQALHIEKTKGIKYKKVPDRKNVLHPEDFANTIDKKTKIVLLSHVQWLTGSKADIKEITKIAHEKEAYVLVDTIQSSGAMINNVKDWDVDFLTCGVAKWLLGPDQRGFFYMKKSLISEFYPPFAGYHGTDRGSDDEPYWNVNKLEYVETIDRFCDTNTGSLLYYIASEGMSILLEYGIEKVQKRIFMLIDYLIQALQEIDGIELLSPLEEECRSGIVNFRIEDNVKLVKKLQQNKILVSSRYGGIRVSPHFYNNTEDIDKLISILKSSSS